MKRNWTPRPGGAAPDGVILFDGVCVLCSWWVRFILERDAAAHFRFVPIQSAYGRALASRWAIDVARPETNAVVLDGTAYFKSDAAIRALAALPRWSMVRLLALLPRRLRDWLYDRVARNRYELFGRTETCLVPGPEIASRFLFDAPPGRELPAAPLSPFQRLLGAEFDQLPEAVRKVHGLSSRLATAGKAEVVCAAGLWPWFICWVAGLPRPGRDVPVTVSFEPDGAGREIWRRRFARRQYSSVLAPGSGAVVEHLGFFTLDFHLAPRPDGLVWSLVRWRFAGLPLPAWSLPKIDCFERSDSGRFTFDIDVAFPFVGQVIHYRGWIAPA